MVRVESDFSDVEVFFDEGQKEIVNIVDEVGKDAVKYAEDNGNYKDRTKRLRKSNVYKADKTGLTLENDMEYASYVEAKGYNVLGNAALYAESMLKKEFE